MGRRQEADDGEGRRKADQDDDAQVATIAGDRRPLSRDGQ
jgi:hypothetical protein